MRRGNGGVISPSTHGEDTWNGPATYQGDRFWRWGAIDRYGVFSASNEVGGVPSRRMPVKGKQPRETQRTLFDFEIEVEGGDYTEVTGTAKLLRFDNYGMHMPEARLIKHR